jgi:pyruvate dehydrogenase E2 component (dihydrolipoamide acetyltransferase)
MDIRLPSLGEGADSGTVVNILVKKGDQIQKDQPILELETEKAVGTIPSTAAGTVTDVRVKVGDKISAGQVIVSVAEAAGTAATTPVAPRASAAETAVATTTPVAAIAAPVIPGFPPPAPPSVRKMANQLGIDLTKIRGSDPGGRITLGDLRAYVENLQRLAFEHRPEGAMPAKHVAEQIDFSQWGPITKKPMSSLRKTIARRMGESWTAVPRVTQFDEADITGLDALRKKYAKAYEAKGARLTLTGLALKAVVATLQKHPIFNTSLDEVAEEVIFKEYYHIGIAVDTEHGLIVPVIRDVDKKSMLDLAKELDALATKTRERKVTGEQMKGGTFTISNQGGIGSGAFTPIVNKPEVAILGMGRGALKPVVIDGNVESRLMLPLGLSYDHRVADGANAARFMVDLVQAFQQFDEKNVRI